MRPNPAPRKARDSGGNTADPGIEVCDLRDLSAVHIIIVDIGDAVLIGKEKQAAGVGRPLGIDVLRIPETRNLRDLAGFHVQKAQAPCGRCPEEKDR